MLAKYRRFVDEAALHMDPAVRWCPKPGCGAVVRGYEALPQPATRLRAGLAETRAAEYHSH